MARQKTKIMIVDDEKDICDITKSFLEKRGYEVLTALDKDEAMQVFREHSPAIILLDIMLGAHSGMDILAEVKAANPQIKILMLTGSEDEANIKQARELGADDYITKPFTTDFLERVVLQKISMMALKSAQERG